MVQATRLYILYLVAGKVMKNIFIDTAEPEASGGTLERFGRVKLGRDPFPATQGQYICDVTGTTGAIIPAETIFKANDNALSPTKLFVLDVAYTLDGIINQITVRALESGTTSQLIVTNQLTATAPIILVDAIIVVASEFIQPQASENIEDYRNKAIIAYRTEPQGGSPADYRLWSLEVQGIVNAYPYATTGATSQIDLFIESDEVDGVPTPADLLAVETNIETATVQQYSRKPVTAIVNYLPITPRLIAVVINDFVDLTVAKQTAIFNAIEFRLSTIRPFIGAIDVVADKDDFLDPNILIISIFEAVPQAIFSTVEFLVDGVPSTTITFVNGDIPKLAIVTYAELYWRKNISLNTATITLG
jgi:uncharacterized phage protein gp47/JayE